MSQVVDLVARTKSKISIRCPFCQKQAHLPMSGDDSFSVDDQGQIYPDFVCLQHTKVVNGKDQFCSFGGPICLPNE